MTIQEMQEKRRKYGYTYAQLSQLSGVPVGTIQKIFRGETVSPRYETFQALERVFASRQNQDGLQETAYYGNRKRRKYMVHVVCWDTVFCSREVTGMAGK
ncbi:MAG: helix-turn-helix domain-containing protein [Lachnospiraceae bacterium]|nr:helix-turn-helix domain-containing protein [Lachnospiraceae bacterium]